jgi:hypothetical protein
MAINVQWNDKNKGFIETRFEDSWTLEEFIEARKRWHRLIKGVDYTVPILLDMQTDYAPEGIMREFIAIHRTPHPRQGHIYLMGMNSTFQKLSKHLFDGVADSSKTVIVIDSIDEVAVSYQPA